MHSDSMAALNTALGGDLACGQVAVVLAPPGVGKTALLVHGAFSVLQQGIAVLHVAVADTVDRVAGHYTQVAEGLKLEDPELGVALRHRMIHSTLDKEFDVAHLAGHLKILRDAANFQPGLVVVDGLDAEAAEQSIGDLVALADSLQVPLWMSMRLVGDIPEAVRAAGTVGIRLTPDAGFVRVSVLRQGTETPLDVALTPDALLIPASRAGAVAPRRVEADTITLYSGGAKGTEAAFGKLATAFGLKQVNFTFPGHTQANTLDTVELSPRQLAAGDVNLEYVSRRLARTYSTEGTLIRKVLQTLWHMVSRSQKVLVVGVIQSDNTVVGGTGWSVELARMWNKDLWVYDQERRDWFSWNGHKWLPGEVHLDAQHIAGTGTRTPEPHALKALEDLFARSF